MRRKAFTGALMLVFCGWLFAGGAGEAGVSATTSAKTDVWAKYDPAITVTCGIVQNISDVSPMGKTPENHAWIDYCRDILGINLKVEWYVPESQWVEKVNLVIASGSMPDMFPVNKLQFGQLVDAGALAPLSEAVEKYASPDTKKVLYGAGAGSMKAVTAGGKLYGIPYFTPSEEATLIPWIKVDWLKKLKMAEPKNLKDLFDVAVAFAKKDPDGNGKEDTIGIGLNKIGVTRGEGWLNLQAFYNGFRAYPGVWLDRGGKLVYGSTLPEAKTALKYFQDLYKAGGIDKEFAVKDSNAVVDDFTAGKVGLSSGPHWLCQYPLTQEITAHPGSDSEWKVLDILTMDGSEAGPSVRRAAFGTVGIVTKNCKYPEAALKMINLLVDKDFNPKKYADMFTPEKGFMWSWVPHKIFTPNNLEVWRNSQKAVFENDKEALARVDNYSRQYQEWFYAGKGYLEDPVKNRQDWCYYYMYIAEDGPWSYFDKYVTKNLFVYDEYWGPPTPTYTEKWSALQGLEEEAFAKIVMGAPIDEFDKFVNQWKSLGGDQITKEVSEWYAKTKS